MQDIRGDIFILIRQKHLMNSRNGIQSWQRLLPESDLLCLLKYDSQDHAKQVLTTFFLP